MVRGHHATAESVARKLGTIPSRCAADKKSRRRDEAADAGAIVAMAGDGVNDAPACARHVGIAMGTGQMCMKTAASPCKGRPERIVKAGA